MRYVKLILALICVLALLGAALGSANDRSHKYRRCYDSCSPQCYRRYGSLREWCFGECGKRCAQTALLDQGISCLVFFIT